MREYSLSIVSRHIGLKNVAFQSSNYNIIILIYRAYRPTNNNVAIFKSTLLVMINIIVNVASSSRHWSHSSFQKIIFNYYRLVTYTVQESKTMMDIHVYWNILHCTIVKLDKRTCSEIHTLRMWYLSDIHWTIFRTVDCRCIYLLM